MSDGVGCVLFGCWLVGSPQIKISGLKRTVPRETYLKSMRQLLAFLFGRLFIYFFNLCGRLDVDMAFGILEAMSEAHNRADEVNKTQENYRKVVNNA